MDTMHAPERESSFERTDRRHRGMTYAVAILTVIALGLGGWLAYELLATADTDVTADVQAVLDDYINAWNDHDGDAFSGLVAPGYRFYDTPGQAGDTAEETAAMITQDLDRLDWAVESIGPSQMVGDEPRIYVTTLDRITGTFATGEGISVLTLVKQGDTWKVQQHTFVGA